MNLKEKVQALCKEKGVTAQKAECDLGFGKGYISKLNASVPNAANIQKMAAYFGVSVDYLVGNVSEPFFHLDNERILREINSYDEEGKPTQDGERVVSDEDIKFALFGGDGEITDAMYEEVKRFARMVKLREEAERKKE